MSDQIVLRSFVVSPAATNCYVAHLKDSEEAICVDPGDRGDALADVIEKEGLKLKGILLTHGHFDHILGVEELKKRLPAKVYAAQAEKGVLMDPGKNLTGDWLGEPSTLSADEYLQDGDVLELAGMEIHMLLTPGHTEGGCCFYLPKQRVCFTGDTLFHGSVGRTDLPGGNFDVLMDSIREKLYPLPDDTAILPGHEDTSVMEWEKQFNPYFKGL